MKFHTFIRTLFLGASFWCIQGFAMEKAFYILRSDSPVEITQAEKSFASLSAHFNSINLLIAQSYRVDQHGLVWGFVDPDLLQFAQDHHLKLMVYVTNEGFDTPATHLFLNNADAQTRAIQKIVMLCQQQHLYGVQFDFEMITLEDRSALTAFYRQAAAKLHEQGLAVSFAVAPVVSNQYRSDFQRRLYQNWEGAYDLSALSKIADFLSVMVYDQHGSGLTPGPTASIRWAEAVIQYVLQYVPAEKFSLGVPVYSDYWYTAASLGDGQGKLKVQAIPIAYNQVQALVHKYHINLQWNDQDQSNQAVFERNWLNEYLFVEDARSFKAKLELVHKYKLRGISVFDLGIEDPAIWPALESQ